MARSRGGWLAVAITAVALGWPRPAVAVEYEIYVDIDDEEELNDLRLTDQIGDDTYETLVELLRRGTNLDEASREELYALPNLTYEEVDRILAYRAEAGRIADPADLVVAGVLTQRKLASIAAFLVVPEAHGKRGGVQGNVRYRTAYVVGDPRVPPMALQARVRALGGLTVGAAALLDPRRLGDVSWDPHRAALVAEPDAVRPRLPKAFAQWDNERWGIIAGTYRIGFGQRLTFDNSRRYTPNGFYLDDAVVARYDTVSLCSEGAGEQLDDPCDTAFSSSEGFLDTGLRVTPSYQITEGLRGVAAGAKHLPLPVGWLQAYGFWSLQVEDLYQYRVYDRRTCQDPRSDEPECDSPDVHRLPADPLASTTTYRSRTLPRMLDVITQGANLAWFRDERTHVGVTGFGSLPRWRVDGVSLDVQPADRLPHGGAFGAVGADFSWGRRWAGLYGEVSRSFDGVPAEQGGGGSYAGILRHTASWEDQELEVVARYYDTGYANPYSRPISARGLYEGNQARDEAGGRVRYTAELAERVDLRSAADVWVHPSSRNARTQLYARVDAQATPWWRPGLWLQYDNQDLGKPSFRQCTEDDTLVPGTEIETQIICGGQRVQLTARSRFQATRRLHFTLQYRHELQNSSYADNDLPRDNFIDDDGQLDEVILETYDANSGDIADDQERFARRNRLRQDINAFLMVSAQPTDALRLRARLRWFWEDIVDNTRLEQSVWAYVEARYQIRRWAIPSLRYDIYAFVDERESTALRRPNPEHWIRFQFESNF